MQAQSALNSCLWVNPHARVQRCQGTKENGSIFTYKTEYKYMTSRGNLYTCRPEFMSTTLDDCFPFIHISIHNFSVFHHFIVLYGRLWQLTIHYLKCEFGFLDSFKTLVTTCTAPQPRLGKFAEYYFKEFLCTLMPFIYFNLRVSRWKRCMTYSELDG